MIYAKERPEKPIWPRLAPWQDAPDPILYALREKLAKDRHESRRVFQSKGKKNPSGLTGIRPGRKEKPGKVAHGWEPVGGLAGKQCVSRFPHIPPRRTFRE